MAKKKSADVFEESLEDRLYDVRTQINHLKLLADKYSAQLLTKMIESGQRRGERFKIAQRQTLKVTEPETAFKWAAERNCIDVNTTKAMQLIRRQFTVPEGFTIQTTEYLTASGKPKSDFADGEGD